MGQTSSSMETRLKRHHSRQPPRRMARNARPDGYIQRFHVEILAADLTNIQADHTEEHYIHILKASGPAGFNNLPGCPGRFKLFWWRYSTARAQKAETGMCTDLSAQGANQAGWNAGDLCTDCTGVLVATLRGSLLPCLNTAL